MPDLWIGASPAVDHCNQLCHPPPPTDRKLDDFTRIMAGDKDTLLSMGFDAARVECKKTILLPNHRVSNQDAQCDVILGALKATGNRGLQPAMDHILENEGKPVPELGSVSESKGSASNAMDVDEDDEDREALESLGIAKATDQEAKVHGSQDGSQGPF